MKKILFIGMTADYGGLETFMMNVFRKLNGKQCQFDFIKDFSNGSIAYEDEIEKKDGTIRIVPTMDRKNRRPIIKYVLRKRLVKNFFRNHHDYSVIHINALNINGIIFWVKEAKKYGIKVIVHLHLDKIDNIISSIGVKPTIFAKVKSLISKFITQVNLRYINEHNDIVKLSASNKAGSYFFNENQFKVINNGIDVNKYKFTNSNKIKVKNELNIDDDYKIVMTVARIAKQKNYNKIIKVFYNLKKLHSKVKLIIIGEGECFNEISSMVKSYGLQDDVYFLGVRKDVNVLLSAADLILMPSLLEAFPFALVESQTAGVPALVSKNVIPEEENITGKLTYLSLENSDQCWATYALKILNDNLDKNKKIEMYNKVKCSKYNLYNSIIEIKRIYGIK